MILSMRVLLFRASYALLIILLVALYPEPWQALGFPLEVDFWPSFYALLSSIWQWLAPLQPVFIALLLMMQWFAWRKFKQQKQKYLHDQQARIGAYQQLEANVYEGKPLFAKGMAAVEYQPVVDALYWQQQQFTALEQKQSRQEKQLAREREAKTKLEQEKRKLSLSILEMKDIDKQRCDQISHLKFCFSDELAKLQERLNYYGALRSRTYQHWSQVFPQLIETCQYLYLEANHPAQAMLAKELKHYLENELDALVNYFDISPERAQKQQWQMPSSLSLQSVAALQSHLISTAHANHWRFILLGDGLSDLFEQLMQQGFNAELVSETAQLASYLPMSLSQSNATCVIVDCDSDLRQNVEAKPAQGTQSEMGIEPLDRLNQLINERLDELDNLLPPDTLLLSVCRQWSWHGVREYQARVDGLLVYPVSLFDLLRCLPIAPVANDEDNLNQLENLLQAQLPKEQDLALLASSEEMQQKHILDTEQHLLPEVPQALFDLAEAAEALTKEQSVAQNSATLIRLSEQLALPMLAVVARELVVQHQQNKDISALCLVLWQCYQESVRAFNARTEF